MPAVSEAQRRKLNAKFGHAWVKAHHFDNAGPLPERVGMKKAKPKKKSTKKAGGKHPMGMPHGLSFRQHKGKC